MSGPARVIINCDGAARGNPGPAGAGAIVVDEDGAVLAEVAEGLGETTNNVAEYTAVIRGLEEAKRLGAHEVLLRSDSQLLINHKESGIAMAMAMMISFVKFADNR